jgi:metal-sulfur cluster biosynthetic enzyme
MTKLSQLDIDQALSKIMHPEITYSLVDLGMLENVIYRQDKVSLTLKLPFPQVPVKDFLIQSIKETLAGLDETIQVKIDIEQMGQKERDTFIKMAKKGWKL